MVYSAIVLCRNAASDVIDYLKKLKGLKSIRVLQGRNIDRDIVIISRDCPDDFIKKLLAKAEESLSSGHDVVIISVRPRVRCRKFVNKVKVILIKMLNRLISILTPEIEYPLLDIIVVRCEVFKELAKSAKNVTNFIISLVQRVIYYSDVLSAKFVHICIDVDDKFLSLLSFTDILHDFKSAFSISDFRVLKFALVGLSGVFVNLGVLYVLREFLNLSTYVAGVLAIEASITNNFTWNTIWTFKLKSRIRGVKDLLVKYVKYHLAVGFGALVNYLTLLILTSVFGIHYLTAHLVGILLNSLSNYLISDRFVWKLQSRQTQG